MLTSRKDAGTGKNDLYWDKEIKRLKAAANYAQAKAQQKIDELILDIDTLRAMLNLRDLQLKKALNKS